MYHVDNSTGVPVMPQPSPVTSETELFFTEGGNGVPPTFPGPDWFNIIQSELINILRAAGLDPDKMDNTQILAALKKLFLSRSNPFGDIKADGAAAIATALSNLGAVAGSGGSYPGDLKFKSVGTNPTERNGVTLVTPTTTAPNGFANWMLSEWYNDQVLWGILRGGSDKATGAGIQVMGLLFSFLADGTMKAGNETVAFQNWVTNNYLKKTDAGSAAGRDVGTGNNQIPDTALLDSLFVRKTAVGTAAAKNVGTGANQIPDMNSFQSGSNANGTWFRLPSGILIQFGMLPSTNPAAYTSITFPTPFTETPAYSLAVTSSTPVMVCAVGANSIGITGVQTFNLAGNQLNNGVPWIAIGR